MQLWTLKQTFGLSHTNCSRTLIALVQTQLLYLTYHVAAKHSSSKRSCNHARITIYTLEYTQSTFAAMYMNIFCAVCLADLSTYVHNYTNKMHNDTNVFSSLRTKEFFGLLLCRHPERMPQLTMVLC